MNLLDEQLSKPLLLEHKPSEEDKLKADGVDIIEDAETITLKQCDKERRYGRVILRYNDICDTPVALIGSLLRYFYPVSIHLMGDDGYCMIGFSPLFRPLPLTRGKMDFKSVPFYMLEQKEGSGSIIAREQHIERKPKSKIITPTAKDIVDSEAAKVRK